MNSYCCSTCSKLDRSKKIWDKNRLFYQYRCSGYKNGGFLSWLRTDIELKQMGCSDWNDNKKPKYEQIKLI